MKPVRTGHGRAIVLASSGRQGHHEGAAGSRTSALRVDRAAVQLHELTRNRQADAETVLRAGVTTDERIEDIWQQLWRNAPSGIADRQYRFAIPLLEREVDAAGISGVGDRVQSEIRHDLL